MRALLFFVFVFFSIAGFGQNLDSLKNHLKEVPESQRFDVVLGYMRHMLKVDPQASYEISNFAIDYASSSGDSLLLTKAFYAQGFILRRLSRNGEAISLFNQAYGIAKRNKYLEELSRILNSLAIAYTYTANYDKALKMHFESLVLSEESKKMEDVGISLNNIGLVYFKLGNTREALNYYERSLAIKESIKSSFDLERLYVNIALCYNQINDYEKSETFIKKAFAFCKDSCAEDILMEAELGLAISYLERGKIDEAKLRIESSLKYSLKLQNRRYEMEGLITMSRIFLAKKQFEEAIKQLSQAEQIAIASGYSQSLMEIYKRMGIVYTELNDYKNSSYYNKKYSDLRDSVISEELINNLATIQANYAERENLSTIADNQKVIRAQRNLNYAIAFIVVMAFAFIYLIMRNSRTIRSLNTRLAQEVQQKTMELVKSNHSLKQVNEELDNLVYKTSHDIRGPLATLKGVCNIALMDVKDDTALAFLKKLDSTSSQLNLVLDKFSRVNEIYNTVIRPQRLNIQAVIDEMVSAQQKVPRQKRIQVIQEIQTIDDFQTSPSLFYYALNSLIDNAFRYYNESPRVDSFIKISVERKRDDVVIRIIDNGVGIPVNIDSDSLFHMFTRGSERSLTGGMGLFIASTAVRKLQGEIKFQRSLDFILTEFIMVLPLKMDFSRIEHPKERGKILPATTELIATLDSRFEK